MERQLSKAFADIQLWKTRYETEGVARCEEIDKVHFATVLAFYLRSKSSYFGLSTAFSTFALFSRGNKAFKEVSC